MTTYYVRTSGSDSNDGLSPGAAKLTIDAVANLVAPGDNCYVGAGVYRELVTMDTSGSGTSQISFIADVTGYYTGDAGLVIISAYPSDETQATRAACLDPDGRTFVTWRGFVFNGGTTGAITAISPGNDNYEGCVFEDCVFQSGFAVGDMALDVDMNAATTPTGNGIHFDRCVFSGISRMRFDGNVSAEQNLKIEFNNCLWIAEPSGQATSVFQWDIVTASTYGSGGLIFNNCSFIGTTYGINVDDGSATASYNVAAYNCIFYRCLTALNKATDNDGALIDGGNNHFYQCSTERNNVTAHATSRTDADIGPPLLGGINDMPLYRFWGWSPYRPFEPIRLPNDSYIAPNIGQAGPTYSPATDLYNEPRPMGTGEEQYYWFDASDDAVTDNEAVWTSEANAYDTAITGYAYTATAGTESTNEIFAGGTNAPSAGPTIVAVRARIWGYVTAATLNTLGHCKIYTDALGESLGELTTWNNTTADWSAWTTLSTPTGGWDYTKLAALEAICWKTADSGANTVYVGQIQVQVQSAPADDIGAVEARARPEKETSTVRTGTNAIRLEGAGYQDFFIPVSAASTTVTVYGRYDSAYTGTLPQLKVLNIPGVADQTDVMVGAADTWEQLSINFTPTSAGVARVRLVSNDTSRDGDCYFDDMAVS